MARVGLLFLGVLVGCASDEPDFGTSESERAPNPEEQLIPPFETGHSSQGFQFPTNEPLDEEDAGGFAEEEGFPSGGGGNGFVGDVLEELDPDASGAGPDDSGGDTFELSCLQILECVGLCGAVGNVSESLACQDSCEQSGGDRDHPRNGEAPPGLHDRKWMSSRRSILCTGGVQRGVFPVPNRWGGEFGGPARETETCNENGGVVCPEKAISPLSVEVVDYATGVPAPGGGEIGLGVYGLKKIEFYSGSMLFGGQGSLPVGWAVDVGDTNGAIRFEENAWRVFSKVELNSPSSASVPTSTRPFLTGEGASRTRMA